MNEIDIIVRVNTNYPDDVARLVAYVFQQYATEQLHRRREPSAEAE